MQIGDFILPTIWKQINGYPNYEISICGHVRNFKTKRVLKPWLNRKNYYCISLYENNMVKKYNIHRLVAFNFIPNINNDKFVDHINNIKLDNTISNLRWCTNQENHLNQPIRINNTSGVKGVYWDKNRLKWVPEIKFNHKKIYLGRYDNFEDAKKARQDKAKELFGEFLNDCEK